MSPVISAYLCYRSITYLAMRFNITLILLLVALYGYGQPSFDSDSARALYRAVLNNQDAYNDQPDATTLGDFKSSFQAYFAYFEPFEGQEAADVNKGFACYRIYRSVSPRLLEEAGTSRIQVLHWGADALTPHPSDSSTVMELGKTHYALGVSYNQQRNGTQALHHLTMADSIFQVNTKDPKHRFVGFAANAMAGAYEYLGQYEKASIQYLRSIEIKKIEGNQLSMAITYNNLGTCMNRLKRYEDALGYFHDALAIYLNPPPVEGRRLDRLRISTSKTWLNLAEVHQNLNQIDSASHYLRLLVNYTKRYPVIANDEPTLIPDTYHSISNLKDIQTQWDSAIYYVDLAIAAYSQYQGYNRRLAEVYLSKGDYLSRLKQYDAAAALYHKGMLLAIGESESARTNDLNDLPPKEKYPVNSIAFIRSIMRKTQLATQRFQTSGNAMYLDRAIALGEYLVDLSDYVRRELSYDDQIVLAGELKQGFDAALIAAHERYTLAPGDAHFDLVLQFSERKKAIALNTILNQVTATQNGGLPAPLRSREQYLREQRNHYQTRVQEAQELGTPIDQIWIDSLHALNERYLALSQHLEKHYPKYYELKFQSPTAHLTDLQKLLQPKEALLSYSIVSDALYIIGLSPKGHFVKRVPITATQLTDEVTAFFNFSQNNSLLQAAQRSQYAEQSHGLYRTLIAPIADKIAGAQTLHLIPEGTLFYLPFESLTSSANVNDFRQMPLLLRSHALMYHYSASQALAPQVATDSRRLLAVAPVEHEDLSIVRSDLGDLPFAEKEVKYITAQYQKYNYTTQSLLKSQATKRRFLDLVTQGDYKVIHLSTHSRAAINAPDLSTLFFHESNTDYRLYARELFNLNITTELLVMSSCESGIGNLAVGEGMISLNRGFLYAGAQNILFSIWQVNDQYTMQLMQYFHDAVLDGAPYPQALQKAKIKLIDAGQFAALPVHWSGFLLLSN